MTEITIATYNVQYRKGMRARGARPAAASSS
jgi:hypothetical protein